MGVFFDARVVALAAVLVHAASGGRVDNEHAARPLQVHVLTMPAHGHYMTTKGVALALAARGHNVSWVLCDRSRTDYDADGMAAAGLAFISAGPCPVYDQRERVLAAVIRSEGGLPALPPPPPSSAGGDDAAAPPPTGLAATRAMLDGVSQLALEMCEAVMAYYAADPQSRLPDVLLFDADSYCGMDVSVVWRVPRVARVGTGPRDPYTTPLTTPAYLSGRKASDDLFFRVTNAAALLVSRALISPWLLPAVYSRHRKHWLGVHGEEGLRAWRARTGAKVGGTSRVGYVCDPTCVDQPAYARPLSPCRCLDESAMRADLPWDGVPTLFNSHWGLEHARPLRPFEHMVGHTNAFQVDGAVPLPPGLAGWLGASDVPVVYVGLGTLSILPTEWLHALAESMIASHQFRFVWSVAAAQQSMLPPSVQLVAAHGACALEPPGSDLGNDACSTISRLGARYPHLEQLYAKLKDAGPGVSGVGTLYLLPWAPQVSVLKHPGVAVFLTHGGMNGVAEGTYAGKPMLCMPLFSDQPDNCARMEDRGFGLTLRFPDLHRRVTGTTMRGKWPSPVLDMELVRLATQPAFRQAVADGWAHNVGAGGVGRAVSIVELAGSRPYGSFITSIPSDAFQTWVVRERVDLAGLALGVGALAVWALRSFGCCCGGAGPKGGVSPRGASPLHSPRRSTPTASPSGRAPASPTSRTPTWTGGGATPTLQMPPLPRQGDESKKTA